MSNDPTERLLALLSLLQSHRQWAAAELADRFGVTPRTIRRDVDRLRDLGYPVDATPGRTGGYRLAAGAHVPPLMFDDDEAVALVVGLRAAAGAAIAEIGDTTVRTLLKVEQSLPDRLRRRVAALEDNVVSLSPGRRGDAVVDPADLSELAMACRDAEEVRFGYRRRDGEHEDRLVEPHQVLSAGHLWYLIAWDLRRADWRTFRLDRLDDVRRAGRRFTPRSIPGGDAAAYLAASVDALPRAVEAVIEVAVPHEQIADVLDRVDHVVVERNSTACTVRLRADHLDGIILDTARLARHAEIHVVDSDDLRGQLDALARRLDAAAAGDSPAAVAGAASGAKPVGQTSASVSSGSGSRPSNDR